ncbi:MULTISPECIES: electron transfer flavoprotein subunit alpha/FixB family protein [unclassified Haloferax]|uniref:electron transfer flavoprotein subunit alpha/FixB family protein n=1 Tax=Haloferax TaxID=2251 RepID=UPI0002B232B0|nr:MULTISPECIES: electron transfer flavoprotein subunit alpha/FixB family protein [unclassified Haloferax]ELZ55002.1 electron transfer flavoprotein subunit alpha [Haloferax sp. ATCC BAA-646]ELZ66068.1 electron transfer flavoprotein subunit alpha [Haloferax sp. ATCC BAA-644]ELZ66682.1 electron transfer flavoprotein subunit alpha [Haloferax sp. ATCC BAA-645]
MTDFDPGDYEISELGPAIKDIDDLGELEEILQAEHRGQNRAPAVALIESRIEKFSEDEEPADADGLDLASMSTAEVGNALQSVEEVSELESLLEREEAGENRDPVKRLISNRIDSVTGSDEEDTEIEVDDRTPEERHPDLDHPTRDKRHVRSLHGGTYRDMWVYCETQAGELVDVSREMLGKARELMDSYNDDYDGSERVVAVLIGADVSKHVEEVIAHGADVVVVREDARLERFQHKPYTEIFCDMARAGATHQNFEVTDGRDESWRDYDKPRYVLFPATNNGRDLSALVQAELDSGLASDCSGLYITEEVISNPVKTGVAGEKKEFQRVLHMKRPDFSGFEYSTILCIDNPTREFHPQGASVIPGSFDVPEPDHEREGLVVKHDAPLDDDWFRVTVTDYDRLDGGIDLTGHEVIVAVGRGIGDDPTKGIELALDLVDQFEDAEVGVTRGIVTGSFNFDGHVEQYTHEDRQIGETGQVVAPKLYVAAGISGAVQHKVGMDESDTIVAVNTDPDARIRDFSDYFIEGDLFEVLPRLTTALKEGRFEAAVASDGGRAASTPPAGTPGGGAGAGAAADDRGESR